MSKKLFCDTQEMHDVFPSAVAHHIPRRADCTSSSWKNFDKWNLQPELRMYFLT